MRNNRFIFIILLTLTGVLAVPAVNAKDSASKEKKISERVLKKYDKDGDGQLNAEEKAAWEADREKAREKRAEARKKDLEKYDKNGDGKINRDERAAMKEDRAKAREERAQKRKAEKEAMAQEKAEN